ncbi:hypothetical protein [Mycobacteroides abscessus]|uniref:hypothetical protein n=1 Tax=Mycobacteroides abscessus TaxID=36809 RepID=UPI001F25F536|nr:hypothetical protein [Mycobacteroides abscessus]
MPRGWQKTPKVLDAIAIWCRYPDEIEADFEHTYPRLDLGWWHRGDRNEHGCMKLSSRKFLNLIYRLPELSEFKTNAAPPFGRNGDWPELTQITAKMHNEIAKYVASRFSTEEHPCEYTVLNSPLERAELAAEAAAQEQYQDEEYDKLLQGVFK